MTRALASAVLLLTFGLSGCGQSSEEPLSDDATSQNTPTEEAPAEGVQEPSAEQEPESTSTYVSTGLLPDPAYPVPDVPAEQLLEYINQLAVREPRGETEAAFVADQISIATSRLAAADRIILSEGIDPGLTEAAVVAKLDALRTLALIDAQDLGRSFATFVDALKENGDARLGLLATVSNFQFEVDRLGSGQTDQSDALLRAIDAVLEHPNADYAEFLATQYAPVVLDSRGFSDQATDMLKKVGNRFAKSENAQLAEEAKELLEQTEFREKVIAALDGGNKEIRALFLAIRDILTDKQELDLNTLDKTLNAAQMLEYNGKFSAARSVFTAVRKAFSEHEDESLAAQAKRSVTYAFKRLDLVGKEINIEGVNIDGTPFTWSKNEGKVVLVDFWATWSGPWQSELANLRAAYDEFRNEGFEVVGVNLDEDRNQVYQFLRASRLPWPIVIDETGGGFGNANAIRYGVEAVPFMALVGRDGKVAHIHVRGTELNQRIKLLLEDSDAEVKRSARKSDDQPVRK